MTISSTSHADTLEQQLFAIAERCRIPLRRLHLEPLRAVTERLTLEIERRITLMLLDLEELAGLDLDELTGEEDDL